MIGNELRLSMELVPSPERVEIYGSDGSLQSVRIPEVKERVEGLVERGRTKGVWMFDDGAPLSSYVDEDQLRLDPGKWDQHRDFEYIPEFPESDLEVVHEVAWSHGLSKVLKANAQHEAAMRTTGVWKIIRAAKRLNWKEFNKHPDLLRRHKHPRADHNRGCLYNTGILSFLERFSFALEASPHSLAITLGRCGPAHSQTWFASAYCAGVRAAVVGALEMLDTKGRGPGTIIVDAKSADTRIQRWRRSLLTQRKPAKVYVLNSGRV